MSIELITPLAPPHPVTIERAALETLAYSDIFDYPLRIDEIHRYLSVPAPLDDLHSALDHQRELIACHDGYYFLSGRQDLVALRLKRESISRPALQHAFLFGRILGRLPFIRMVALTGSLALLNSEANADLDYMLVAVHGRVWMARAFALLFGRLTRLFGYTLCPNLIISDRVLAWRQRDVYTAREICQMIPIAGSAVYSHLRCINDWTGHFLPNASSTPPLTEASADSRPLVQLIQEWALSGKLGDRLEAWEMDRKIRRFSQQAGFGAETLFDADMCQGNFHHHGAQTRQALRDRLAQLGIESSVALPAPQCDSSGRLVGEKTMPVSASRNNPSGDRAALARVPKTE